MLSLPHGEFRPAAVRNYGTDFMHAINAMRFALRGLVARLTMPSPQMSCPDEIRERPRVIRKLIALTRDRLPALG
jgi:hypothetical protein